VDNFSSLSASTELRAGIESDIFDINWGTVDSARVSEDGAGGVLFVKRKGGAMVCVKGSMSSLTEVYATQMALMVNISVPRVRVLTSSMTEMNEFLRNAKKMNQRCGRSSRIFQKTHLLIMEYVSGRPPWGWKRVEMDSLLSPVTDEGKSRLRELGRLMALDVTCNNQDRFPLIWNNNGNIDNVLLQSDDGGLVVGIDNQAVFLKPEYDTYAKYMKKVKDLVAWLVNSPKEEFPGMAKVRDQYELFTKYRIPQEGGIQMQIGVMEGILRFAALESEDFSSLCDKLCSWDTVLEKQKDTVRVAFLNDVVTIYKDNSEKLLDSLDLFENTKPYIN